MSNKRDEKRSGRTRHHHRSPPPPPPKQAFIPLEDDDDLGAPDPPPKQYVDNITPLLSTLFTSIFVVGLLYAFASQKELWVLVFGVIDVFLLAIKKLVAKHYYTKLERDDIDALVVMQFFRLLHTTVIFVITKIFYDIVTFLVLTSTMYWYNYIDVIMPVVIFGYVVFTSVQ